MRTTVPIPMYMRVGLPVQDGRQPLAPVDARTGCLQVDPAVRSSAPADVGPLTKALSYESSFALWYVT